MKPSSAAGASDLHHELEDLQKALQDPARSGEMDRILDRFGHVQEEYEHLGGYALEAQAREVLHGLGFADDQIDGDVGALSGGWKMRVALARVLLLPSGRAADGRAHQSPGHRIHHLVGGVPEVLPRCAADDLARPRVHEPHRDENRRDRWRGDHHVFRQLRFLRTRARHSETNQQAAFARQQAMLAKEQRFIDRFRTHAAKAAQVQSRIKALDKIEKSSCPRNARW